MDFTEQFQWILVLSICVSLALHALGHYRERVK